MLKWKTAVENIETNITIELSNIDQDAIFFNVNNHIPNTQGLNCYRPDELEQQIDDFTQRTERQIIDIYECLQEMS